MKNLIYIGLTANSSDTALMLELHEKYPEFSTGYIIIGEIGDYPQAKLERYHLTFSPLKKALLHNHLSHPAIELESKFSLGL